MHKKHAADSRAQEEAAEGKGGFLEERTCTVASRVTKHDGDLVRARARRSYERIRSNIITSVMCAQTHQDIPHPVQRSTRGVFSSVVSARTHRGGGPPRKGGGESGQGGGLWRRTRGLAERGLSGRFMNLSRAGEERKEDGRTGDRCGKSEFFELCHQARRRRRGASAAGY